MTCATATFPPVTPFDILGLGLGEAHRALFRNIAVGLGTAAAACVAGGVITVTAAGIVSGVASVNAHFLARGPIGLATVARGNPYRLWGDMAEHTGSVRVPTNPVHALAPMIDDNPPRMAALTSAPASAAPPPLDDDPDITNSAPSPMRSLFDDAYVPQLANERFSTGYAAPQFAAFVPDIPASPQNPLTPESVQKVPIFLPDPDSRTAVYEIKSHTVYLPNGDRLEAHSGLGKRRDDPRFAADKNKGPTPPNVYTLTMRERPFHGIRALRLNPVPGSTMHGRDGILAHTYMLGSSGQSLGCVSFKNYPAFLRAFLDGKIDRIVVVPELGTKVSAAALAWRSSSEQ